MKSSILKNHIAIQGWMVEDMHLRCNKLIIFAIIWGIIRLVGLCTKKKEPLLVETEMQAEEKVEQEEPSLQEEASQTETK